MKKTILALFLASTVFLTAGCSLGSPEQAGQDQSVVGDISDTASSVSPTADSQSSQQTRSEVKRYYPEPLSAPSGSAQVDAGNARKGNPLPDNLEARLYLVEKYDPGICYGKDVPVTSQSTSYLIGNNPELDSVLRQKYGLSSDLDVYVKMKQLFGITFAPAPGGKLAYSFTDGQCENATYYAGEISNIAGRISETIIDKVEK